ncbi:MAG: FecCD family ABC transporter permease [Phycisphaerae bacterium]
MKALGPKRYFIWLALCGLLLLAAVVVSPGIGTQSARVGLLDAWRACIHGEVDAQAYRIGFVLRMPRTLLALQTGITLGLCGAVFQTLFRNPLATPYTLGIASGGSLGALLAIHIGIGFSVWGIAARSLSAFLGASLVIVVIFLFARTARRLATAELLLAGVTMGLFCSAAVMFITYLSDQWQTFSMVRWMMGSLVIVSLSDATLGLMLLLPSWAVLIGCAKSLNQYALGEEIAATRGVHVARLRAVCILFASLATAVVVAACGPIGFVGLVVPQITGLLVGRDCRILLPVSAMLGGVFLAGCDWLSQLAMGWIGALSGRPLGSVILPVGVVTAMLGVPVFLFLLHRRAASAV